MLENYDVEWEERSEIEGRPVEVIEVTPFHPSPGAQGPRKCLAIDTQTGLTLRLETYDHQRQLVMRTTLTNVDYAPTVTPVSPDKIIQVSHQKDWMIQDLGDDSERVFKLTGLHPPQTGYLPAGFQFDTVGVHHCNYEKSPFQAALTRYTDGVNTLTIFVMKPGAGVANCEPKSSGPAVMDQKSLVRPVAADAGGLDTPQSGKGQTCDFGPGTLVMRNTPQGRLIAVGDLPAAELQRVLDDASIVQPGNVQSNQAR
jgi:hypothetical protein